jgi:hypothetical protein
MEDLHRLLANARGDLPPRSAALDLDEISARGRKIIRRRRWSVVAAAVAVTLAAGSLLPFVRGEHRATPIGPPTPNTEVFAARMLGYPAGDFQVGASIQVTPGYEVAPISRAARVVGSVEVYRPGVFDPRFFLTGTPVAVAGRSGFLLVDTADVRYGDSRLGKINKSAVAWPYADNAWAIVRSSADSPVAGLTAGSVQQVASRFALGPPAPVRLPFRVGYVPPGFSVLSAGRINLAFANDKTLGRLGEVTLAAGRSFNGLTGPLPLDGITVVEERQQAGVPRDGITCDSYGCYRGLPGTDLYLGVTGKFPAAQLRKVLDGVTTADPSDQGAWFPLRD